MRGTAELAMLAAPSEEEYEDFRRAVAVMTDEEKAHPEELSDEEIREIAQRCGAASGNISIFVNGYVLARRQEQACPSNKDKEN
jgi:signal recognition particle GTPase